MSRRVLVSLVGVGTIVVLVAVWYVALWKPRADKVNQLKAEVTAANYQESQLQAQLATNRAEERQLPSAKATIQRTSSAVPADSDIASLIYYVNNEAKASGVTFLNITDGKPVAVTAVVTTSTTAPTSVPAAAVASTATGTLPDQIGVTITGSGSFFNVLDFLNHLGAMPRLMVIQTLSLSPGAGSNPNITGGSTGPIITFNIGAEIFTSTAATSTGGQ